MLDIKPIIIVDENGSLKAVEKVRGWKKAQKLLAGRGARKLVLFATGAMPNEAEDTIQKMWGQNLTPAELDAIPHFYLQAGLCYERMGGVDRAIMSIVHHFQYF